MSETCLLYAIQGQSGSSSKAARRISLVNLDVVRQVWQRAESRCEYCHLPAAISPLPFHVDHIMARQHGGATAIDNLALACLHCNRHKGPNIAGHDAATGDLVGFSTHARTDGAIIST